LESNQFDEALSARDLKIAIVAARFNQEITDLLLAGALETLGNAGYEEAPIVFRVPGCWELPVIARELALTQSYEAVVCLGCVIRGETPHFEYVAGECARGLQQIQIDTGTPIIFGVLTTDTVEQAQERAGGDVGNKGSDAVLTAIEMAHLMRSLRG
jgi:6,7-dimethyl-8-ribityllumazine synthase